MSVLTNGSDKATSIASGWVGSGDSDDDVVSAKASDPANFAKI